MSTCINLYSFELLDCYFFVFPLLTWNNEFFFWSAKTLIERGVLKQCNSLTKSQSKAKQLLTGLARVFLFEVVWQTHRLFVAGHTAPVHRATLNCVVPKKLGLLSYEQAYQPLRIGSFQREVQLWDVAPPSDENRSRGDGLDKSQLASGCSINKKETRILPNSTPWPKPSSHSDPHISDPRCHPTMMGLSRREFSFDKYSPSCTKKTRQRFILATYNRSTNAP